MTSSPRQHPATAPPPAPVPALPPPSPLSKRRVYLGTSFGQLVEWYDFSVYGFLAVYIGASFFPGVSPTARLLATFGVLGFTFLIRPLGGVFFGPLADRIGRRAVLIIVVLLMSLSTMLIGLLPGYATLGIAAPILLVVLRGLQNFAAGGDFGSVPLMIEWSGPRRRGYASSWLMFTAMAGFLVGAVLAFLLATGLGTHTMAAWGWRIPFVIAGPLGLIGLYIRWRLEDSPEYQALKAAGEIAAAPLRESLRYRREILTGLALGGLHSGAVYTVLTFMPSYLTQTLGYGSTVGLVASIIGPAAILTPLPFVSTLSDRIGRRPVLIATTSALAVFAFPLLMLAGTSPAGGIAAQVVLGLLVGLLVSTTLVAITEVFPVRVRSAGSSFAFTVSGAVLGGTAPFTAVLLVSLTGSHIAPAGYLAFLAVLAILASFAFHDGRSLDEHSPPPESSHT